MVRKIRKTFDREVLIRCLTAATILYVVGTAAVHGTSARALSLAAGGVLGR